MVPSWQRRSPPSPLASAVSLALSGECQEYRSLWRRGACRQDSPLSLWAWQPRVLYSITSAYGALLITTRQVATGACSESFPTPVWPRLLP
jgi:hypothetical protein